MIVTVHGSNVLSPATFNVRPLNGISTEPILDAGRAAVWKLLELSAAIRQAPVGGDFEVFID
jgi:hypothetical protein